MMNTKLFGAMQKDNIDLMILCRPDNVAYVTGYDTPISYGASDSCVDGAFTYAVVDAQRGKVTMLAADCVFGSAKENSFADEVLPFGTMDFFEDKHYPQCLYSLFDDVLDGVGLPLLGIVPEDSGVTLAAAKGVPLPLYSEKGAARACRNIARRLCGQKVPLMLF